MESANTHQLHQDQLVIGSPPPPPSSSSSLPTPSSRYGLASSSSTHALTPTPNVTLNAGNFNQSYNGVILNSSNSPRIQESAAGFHWINNSQSAHDHFAEIKDPFPKFTEMVNIPSSNNIEDHSDHLTTTSYLKNQEQKNLNDLSHKLLLQTISSGFPINGNNDQFPAGDFDSSFGNAMPSRGNCFSQIYPSINISNYLNQSSSATSSNNFDMNLQPAALELLSLPFCFDDHLQQSSRRPSRSPSNKISHLTDSSEITEAAKRPSCLMQPKSTQQSASKKTRLESRASCPPFKVRKEKLGDRIAALQQMVAPFGKTDTASVLMEAIGYIKFLQNQVETLSVPYMKASPSSKSSRTIQGKAMAAENREEEPERDLRSRGLCLVPLSCMSYVANDAGAGGAIWPPPPNFGGGT